MVNIQTLSKPVIKLSSLKEALFSTVFIALSIAMPLLAHQFNLAGQIYLPMHIFIFIAALLFGWRTGLLVGLISPILSHYFSGMPLLAMLPQITVELALYGLIAGVLREKFKLNLYLSLVLAMIGGRIGLLLAVAMLHSSPVPYLAVKSVVVMGWPGMLLQLAAIPVAVHFVSQWLHKYSE